MSESANNLRRDKGQMQAMAGVIRLFEGGKFKGEFRLEEREPLVIGRSPECDIVLPDSLISRRHAKVIAHDGVVAVKDLGSAHGIQVGGQSVPEGNLESQGEFSILRYQFKYISAVDRNMEQKTHDDYATTNVGGVGPIVGKVPSQGHYPGAVDSYGDYDSSASFIDGPTILAEVIGIARDQWRLIASFLVGALLVGSLHGFLAVPTFETNASVQVEPKVREIGGPFSDFDNSRRVNDALIDENEILRSRTVLGEVVDNLGLSIIARPAYFPSIGAAIARGRADNDLVKQAVFGLNSYVWSNESIVVDSMEIPDEFLAQPFRIVAGGGGTFKVIDVDDNVLANGRVGMPLLDWLPTEESSALYVSELRANRGAVFQLTKIPRLSAIENLRKLLRITDAGIESSILRISLSGAEPENISKIVNEIVTVYVGQNVKRQSEVATRTLQFLKQQIPLAKQKMESTEARLNEMQLQRGSVDLPRDTQVVLDKIVRLESQVSELQRSRAQLIERFTPQHPRIRSLDGQLARLRDELVATESEVRDLPTTQREVVSLSREVAVTSELYLSLVNRAQELQVVSEYAATIGNLHVVDYASVPLLPYSPNKQFLMMVYMLLALLLSAGIILFKRQLRNVVTNPELIEARLNLPIYAALPHSLHQENLGNQTGDARSPILAASSPRDPAIEGLRSLRTSLQFAFVNAENNILLITGPTARIGKTFVASNLAAVLAASGRSVVIVDADLRRGNLHNQFGLSREPGLADYIAGDVDLAEITHETDTKGLHVVSAGAIPPNPSELLMHLRFRRQLQDLSARFDHVIIDSPPLLAVTDPVLISNLAGVVLLVVKAGFHPMREIEQSVKRLIRVGANLKGVVFNDMPVSASSAYGYESYDNYTKDRGASGQSI